MVRIYFHFNLQRQSLLVHEVARHLQSTRGWRDFAGVVVVKEGRHYDFLSKQQDVTYQYLDRVEGIEKTALDRPVSAAHLETWEKRLDRPMWHLVVADRNIGRMYVKGGRILHTDFGRVATQDNMARLVCSYLDFYRERLEAFRPDAVFMTSRAALHSLALVEVCQWMHIPFFTLRPTRVFDRYTIAQDDAAERFLAIERRFGELLEQSERPRPPEQALRYYESFQEARPESPGYAITVSNAQQRMQHKHPLRFWGGIGYRLAQAVIRWIRCQDPARRDLRFSSPLEEWWLETQRIIGVRYPSTPGAESSRIGEEPYVYYPLHMNPEASTMILAPNFVDQLAVIEALAKNVPFTHKLYVKEHPSMLGRRPRGFYSEVKKYPNVRLLDTSESSHRLIRNADLVAVITGTVGWEGILMGKPVITFGQAYYGALGLSERCSDLSKLGLQIRRLIYEGGERTNRERVLLFLTALFERSFPLSTHVMWRKVLEPGQLSEEDLATAGTVADELAAAIERVLTERDGGHASAGEDA